MYCGHGLVTLSLTINKTLKCLSSLPIVMLVILVVTLSVAIGVYSPSSLTSYPYRQFPPSLISLMVSVDVKYHVYFTNINNFKHNLKHSPGEIKRREVSWTLAEKLAQKRSRAGRWCGA